MLKCYFARDGSRPFWDKEPDKTGIFIRKISQFGPEYGIVKINEP